MLYLINGILFCSLAFVIIFAGYPGVRYLRRMVPAGKRAYTPQTHTGKSQTPSIGGILFMPILAVLGVILAFIYHDVQHILVSFLILSFMMIGLYDDISKLWYQKGVSELHKLLLQVVCAAIFAVIWYASLSSTIIWYTPVGIWSVPSGVWCIPWVIFLVVGASNAINLTDGLDGLATTVVMWHAIISIGIASIMAATDLSIFSGYIVWLSALAGVMLGFLWHNAYPARIFMGDVGSLSLGALCAGLAVISGTEWFLPITLIIPVIETLSVIVQVISRTYFGVRVFRFAPIHHHFEMIGWHEATIVTRATLVCMLIASILLVVLGG